METFAAWIFKYFNKLRKITAFEITLEFFILKISSNYREQPRMRGRPYF